MSCFICDDNLFQAIANRLPWDFANTRGYDLVGAIMSGRHVFRFGSDRYELATLMVNDWIETNRASYLTRYGSPNGDSDPFTVTCDIMAKGISLVALWRAIKCLRYQCDEAVGEHHESVKAEMDAAIKLIADAIIEDMDECKALKWGEVPDAGSVLG